MNAFSCPYVYRHEENGMTNMTTELTFDQLDMVSGGDKVTWDGPFGLTFQVSQEPPGGAVVGTI
jgi:hypothetical protein